MKYTKSRTITTNNNSEDYCIKFLVNINETLKYYDFKTKTNTTSIEFEKTFRSTTNSGYNRKEAFKNLRTGRIDLIIQSNNIITIKSIIDLSHLTFLTLFSGFCLFLFGWFWDFNLKGIGIFSIISMIIIYFIGWVRVTDKIEKIIEIAKEKT